MFGVFQKPRNSLAYSDFVKQTHERFKVMKTHVKILLAMGVFFESECFHINCEKYFESKSYF